MIFISITFPDMLVDAHLLLRRRMWFMHDGVMNGDADEMTDVSHENRYIRVGALAPWPSRSPVLNPLDFFSVDPSK